MIPMLYNNALYARYSTRTLPAAAPIVDAGTAKDVFQRADISGKGPRQRRFISDASGKVVLRVGFDMVALDRDACADLLRRVLGDDQLSTPGDPKMTASQSS